jgi:hypothetical protein
MAAFSKVGKLGCSCCKEDIDPKKKKEGSDSDEMWILT